MRWVGLILGLVACLGLSGCLTLNEAISSGASATAALVTTSAGLPPVVTVAAVAATDVAVGVLTEENVLVPRETVEAIQNPWQAMFLAFDQLLNHAFEVVIAIGVAVLGIPMIISFAIGKVMPNRKTKEMDQENKVLKKIMEKSNAVQVRETTEIPVRQPSGDSS